VFAPRLLLRNARREMVATPLFGPYVFVRFGPGDGWVRALHTVGVQAILRGCDNRPRPVPVGYVEALIRHGDTEVETARDERIEVGARLRISRGPLAGLTGRCVTSERARVRVLLEWMGGTPVNVPRAHVAVEP
jgi:transcription antitermination factor NusG